MEQWGSREGRGGWCAGEEGRRWRRAPTRRAGVRPRSPLLSFGSSGTRGDINTYIGGI